MALHALVTAEIMRFPAMAAALREGGTDGGITRLTALLLAYAPHLTQAEAAFAAEQFQNMIVVGPAAPGHGAGRDTGPGGPGGMVPRQPGAAAARAPAALGRN